MNAKAYNKSITRLFFGGDPLAMMVRDGMRQLDDAVREERQRRQVMRDTFSQVSECPCGCGLQGDICEAHMIAVQIANEALPF